MLYTLSGIKLKLATIAKRAREKSTKLTKFASCVLGHPKCFRRPKTTYRYPTLHGVRLYVSANSRKGTWGTAAIDEISELLRREQPGLRGFSAQNIRNMRQFAEFWQPFLIRSPMATEMDFDKLQDDIECDRFSLTKWSPMASDINREEFLGMSFSHHMEILHKTKDIDEVLLCIHEAVTHQWDKYTLRNILKAGIPKPDSYAPNNFMQTMPSTRQGMKAIRMFQVYR